MVNLLSVNCGFVLIRYSKQLPLLQLSYDLYASLYVERFLISLNDSICLGSRKVLPFLDGFLRIYIYEYPYASQTSDGDNYVISALNIVNDGQEINEAAVR